MDGFQDRSGFRAVVIFWLTVQGPPSKLEQSKEQTSLRIILSVRIVLKTDYMFYLWRGITVCLFNHRQGLLIGQIDC